MATPRRVAVVGGGWAGMAAAVEACRRGHAVTLYEMASQLGGRARDLAHADPAAGTLDNGQHILIGAYGATLALMREVGVDPETVLLRLPLSLRGPDDAGLTLRPGPPALAFAAAVMRHPQWRLADRLALLAAAASWAWRGFRCPASVTVAALTRRLPRTVRDTLTDPLCVAALNTPADEASATVFLRVLRDALLSGPGSADLLLPRVGLGDLLPRPAGRWLAQRGATVKCGHRVRTLSPRGGGWDVDGERHDAVVLAAPPGVAAELAQHLSPSWSARAAALRCEPIVTVYAHSGGARLPQPMLALPCGDEMPAQFVFDRGQLGGPAGLLAFVVSGAAPWVERGTAALWEATRRQAESALARQLGGPLSAVRTITEKRATFRCTPGLQRPPMRIAEGLFAAGDHVDGPYPATLEGAVRAGRAAVDAISG